MLRRIINVIAMGMVFLLTVSALASQTGSIQVETEGGTVALYRVGDFEQTYFRLLEAYGGRTVTFDETLSPELAQELAAIARGGYVKAADLHGNVVFSDREPGLYLIVQRTAPDGYEAFTPFLVSLPWDGDQWEVKAQPKLEGEQPNTGDSAEPMYWLGAMAFSAAGIFCCVWLGWEELRKI